MHPLPRLIAAIAVIASLLAAGCGDSSEKNDYVDDVNALQNDLVADVSAAAATTPTNQKQAADGFEAVDPPDDVADLHSQLVDQIRSIAAETRKAEQTLRQGTPQEAQKALSQLQTAATDAQNRLNMLIDEINADLHD